MIRLGDISFGLGADTSRLQRSMNILNAFGRQVDAVAATSGTAARRTEAALRRQEAATTSALDKMLKLNQAMRKVEGTDKIILQSTNAFRELNLAMTRGKLSALEFQRAQERFNASFSQATRAFRDYKTQMQAPVGLNDQLIKSFQTIASTALLVAGPLSGIATRLVSIAAIIKRGGVSLAAFTVGIAAGIKTLHMFGGEIIRAGAQMKSFEATFKAVTGSVASGNRMLEEGIAIARKTGALIVDLVPSYAKFQAAAKGTNLEGEKARYIFETVAAASTTLGLSNEAALGSFRALEQMISKGTVQAEELKGQLGDRMPGALQIAARAMGVTTTQLAKMMKEGSLITDDFLPKFARELNRTFNLGDNSVRNFTSAWNNLQNAMFQLFAELDRKLGITDRLLVVMETLTKVLDSVRINLDRIIPVLGAVGGALLGLAAPALLTGLGGLLRMIKALTIATWSFNAAAAANPVGGLVMLLARLGLAAGGAVFGMEMMKRAMDDTSSAALDAETSYEKWIDSSGRIVESGNATSIMMQELAAATDKTANALGRFDNMDGDMVAEFDQNTKKMLESIDQRIQGMIAQIQAQQSLLDLSGSQPTARKAITTIYSLLGLPTPDEMDKQVHEQINRLRGNIDRLRTLREQIYQNNNPTQKGDMAEGDENVLQKTAEDLKNLGKAGKNIDDVIEDIAALKRILKFEDSGLDKILQAESLEQAREMLRGLAEEDLAELTARLKEAGFTGATTLDMLGQAVETRRQLQEKLDTLKNGLSEKGNRKKSRSDEALSDIQREIDRTRTQIDDILNNTRKLEELQKVWDREDKVEQYADKLQNAGVATGVIALKTQELADALERLDGLMEETKGIEEFRDKLEQAFDTAADSFVDMALDFELSAKGMLDLVKSVVKEIIKEFIKLSIINPLKNALFNTNEPTLSASQIVNNLIGGGRATSTAASSNAAVASVARTIAESRTKDDLLTAPISPVERKQLPEIVSKAVDPITRRIEDSFGQFPDNNARIMDRLDSGFSATSTTPHPFDIPPMGIRSGVNTNFDPRLMDILQTASTRFPLQSKLTSGLRPGDPRFHGKGMAADIQLYGADGKALANYQDPSTFRDYELFAQEVRRVQMEKYPELAQDLRWGGYFSGGKGKYGAMDPMHFDLGGRRVGMGGGSWEGGLNTRQLALWPGAESVGMNDPQNAAGALEALASKATQAGDSLTNTLVPSFDSLTQTLTQSSMEIPQALDISATSLGSGVDSFTNGMDGIFSQLGQGLEGILSGLGNILSGLLGGGGGGGVGSILSTIIGAILPKAAKGDLLTRATPVIGGEAGVEAIMPLGRDSAGRLGVRAQGSDGGEGGQQIVNVILPEGTRAKTKQSEKGGRSQLDVFVEQVENRIATNMAKGGTPMNKAIEGRYALNAAAGLKNVGG